MESPPGADEVARGGPAPGGGEGDLAICPICGSAFTWRYRTDVVDTEYFVVPARLFAFQKCGELRI